MSTTTANKRFSILVINPNTSTHMTEALKPILESLEYTDIQFDYFTAPSEQVASSDGRVVSGIASINSGEESSQSALHCRPFLSSLVPKYDAFLVACYSAHPLVGMLKEEIQNLEESSGSNSQRRKYVTGIFEASVLTSLSLTSSFELLDTSSLNKAQAPDTFGIVSTGSTWEVELRNAVNEMLVRPRQGGSVTTSRFAGVTTTGLTAVELHTTSPEEVRKRIIQATERLVQGSSSGPVSAICMGCAGMAGMEEAVREGCVRAYGERRGNRVRIVDGVVAGAGMLVTACKAGF